LSRPSTLRGGYVLIMNKNWQHESHKISNSQIQNISKYLISKKYATNKTI
jgi:hypothetical protein